MSEMTPFQNKDAIATTTAFAARTTSRPSPTCGTSTSFMLGARPEFESLYLGLEGCSRSTG